MQLIISSILDLMDYGINLCHQAWYESFYSDNVYNKIKTENLHDSVWAVGPGGTLLKITQLTVEPLSHAAPF